MRRKAMSLRFCYASPCSLHEPDTAAYSNIRMAIFAPASLTSLFSLGGVDLVARHPGVHEVGGQFHPLLVENIDFTQGSLPRL